MKFLMQPMMTTSWWPETLSLSGSLRFHGGPERSRSWPQVLSLTPPGSDNDFESEGRLCSDIEANDMSSRLPIREEPCEAGDGLGRLLSHEGDAEPEGRLEEHMEEAPKSMYDGFECIDYDLMPDITVEEMSKRQSKRLARILEGVKQELSLIHI